MAGLSRTVTVPGAQGAALLLRAGQRARIVNTHGQQVVDTWAFDPANALEFLSMEHSRVATYKILYEVGDTLVSNTRRPFLTITADTSPGIHDTLYAACDAHEYARAGLPAHANCADNLRAALAPLGLAPPVVPCPWNLFEHAPIVWGRYLRDDPSEARPGDYIELRAEADLVLACSSCPSGIAPISGAGRPPRSVAIEVWDAA